jgi:hypothetical protein
MRIEKALLTGALIFFGANTMLFAQQTNQERTVNIQELMTPIKPADGRPYVFNSQADLDAAREKKMEGIKMDIRQNADNPQRVKAMRENLWRIENAIIQK